MNSIKSSLIVSALFVTTSFSLANTVERTVDRQCDKPEASVYKTSDMNKPVPLTVMLDYVGLNSKDGRSYKGVAVVENKKGEKKYLPVFFSKRGNSRGSHCEAPPFRMSFMSDTIAKEIEQKLLAAEIAVGSEGYLKSYYDQLQTMVVDLNTQVEGPKTGLFAGVGDDIKVVTHCGLSTWANIGGPDETSQNVRLMSEFYIYQMLAEMRMPVEMTRLANITYYNADGTPAYKDGENAKFKLAFFREPPKSVAKRCGLESKIEDVTKNNPAIGLANQAEPTAEFAATFMNKLVYNNDFAMAWGHNSNKFFNGKGQFVYGAYDFDLSGIISKGYSKNLPTVEGNVTSLLEWMKNHPTADTQTMIYRTLSNRAAMQKVINLADLPAEQKAEFQKWLDLTFDALAIEVSQQVIQTQKSKQAQQEPAAVVPQ